MTTRREFLKTGFAGSLLLSAGGCGTVAYSERQLILNVLSRVMLQSALPANTVTRDALLARTAGNVESTIAGLPLATQAELEQLFSLLDSWFGRCLLAGVWSPWEKASDSEIAEFLESWRHSRFNLLRSAYAGLHDLILGAWYAEPDTWTAIGYPGPPNIRE